MKWSDFETAIRTAQEVCCHFQLSLLRIPSGRRVRIHIA